MTINNIIKQAKANGGLCMNVTIGKTILELRKEKVLTQEQLAKVFGVSVAAVSKWETGISYPDIELLSKIADFFDISVDRLIGHDMNKAKMSIEECLKKANDLFYNERKEKEAIAYLGSLAYKYPNNVEILVKYAQAQINSVYGRPKNENHKKLFKDAEDILLSINKNGLSRYEHDLIMNALFSLYMWNKRFDKVEKILAEQQPAENFRDMDSTEFWFFTHKGDIEKAREKYYYILERTFLNETLLNGHYHFNYDEPEKVIDINNKYIKLIEIFVENFSIYPYSKLSILHESNAYMYFRLDKQDKVLAEIEKSIDIAVKKGDSYDLFMESFMKYIIGDEKKDFELIKDTDEFKKLTEKLNK